MDIVGLIGDRQKSAETDAVELTARLYEYLGGVGELRAQTSATTEELIGQGKGLWLVDLPENEAVSDNRADANAPVLTVGHIEMVRSPHVGANIEPWMDGPFDRPGWEPTVRTEIVAGVTGGADVSEELMLVRLSDEPEIEAEIEIWLEAWRTWAAEDIRDAPVRKLYRLLDELRGTVERGPEDYEILLESGFLELKRDTESEKAEHTQEIHFVGAITKAESGELELHVAGQDLVTLAEDFTQDQALAVVIRPIDPPSYMGVLNQVAAEIRADQVFPNALLADHELDQTVDTRPVGSFVEVGGNSLMPQDLSGMQLDAIRHSASEVPTVLRYDSHCDAEILQTTVRIVEHLLALGRRVLVTGHSEDRLSQIRDGLADEIRSLTGTLTGHEFDGSVVADVDNEIAEFSEAYTVEEATQHELNIQSDLGLLLDQLEGQRQELARLKALETTQHEIHDVVGTIGQIDQWHSETASDYDWFELVDGAAKQSCPISNGDFGRWLRLMRNQVSQSDIELLAQLNPTIALDGVASLDSFSDLLNATSDPIDPSVAASLNDRIVDMDSGQRRELLQDLRHHLAKITNNDLAASIGEHIVDSGDGDFHAWSARQTQIAAAMSSIHATHSKWSHLPVVLSMDLGEATKSAYEVLEYLEQGRTIRLNQDGTPKTGLGSSKAMKNNADFFSKVTVAGRPAVEAELLTAFVEGSQAWRLLDEVDSSWPTDAPVPSGATISDRLAWHDSELRKLNNILDSAKWIHRQFEELYRKGFPVGDSWNSARDVELFIGEIDAVDGVYRQAESQVELSMLADRVSKLKANAKDRSWAGPLLDAISERNVKAYDAALGRRLALVRWDAQMNWLGDVRSRLRPCAPSVVAAMEASPADSAWDERAGKFQEAWRWAAVGEWLVENEPPKPSVVSRRIEFVNDQLRDTASQLVYLRARRGALTRWLELSDSERSGLAVAPAWFVPLVSVPDQMEISYGTFDVVVVDEASKMGLESMFLQFMAPKLVVIGDGLQRASAPNDPSALALSTLAASLVPDRLRANWTRPEISLFDDYASRFENVLEFAAPAMGSENGESSELSDELSDEDGAPSPFKSLFEQRVFDRLVSGGYAIESHIDSDDYDEYAISLLVQGEVESLGVEISEDTWEGPEALANRIASRRMLERAGSTFHRVSKAEYSADPDRAIAGLLRRLSVLNIAPVAERETEELLGSVQVDSLQFAEGSQLAYQRSPMGAGFGEISEPVALFAELGTREQIDAVPKPAVPLPLEIPEQPHIIDLTGSSGSEAVIEIEIDEVQDDEAGQVDADLETEPESESESESKAVLELDEKPEESLNKVSLEGELLVENGANTKAGIPRKSLFGNWDPESLPPGEDHAQSASESLPPVFPERDQTPAETARNLEDDVDKGFLFKQPEMVADGLDNGADSVAGFKTAAFARYVEWQPSSQFAADSMARDELMQLLAEATRTEGPVSVERLYRSLMTKSSGGRLNRKMRNKLDEALQAAEKGGLVAIEAPLDGSALSDFWVSCPGEQVVARRRGKRKITDIPPTEVIAALDLLDDGTGDVHRKLANKWDLGRLGFEAKKYLKACDLLRSER